MKKTPLLLLAAFVATTTLSFAQGLLPESKDPAVKLTPVTETEIKALRDSLLTASTSESIATWEENELGPQIENLDKEQLSVLVLVLAAQKAKSDPASSSTDIMVETVSEYLPDWETSGNKAATQAYFSRDVFPAAGNLRKDIRTALTKEEFASLVETYCDHNLYPDGSGRDSRAYLIENFTPEIAEAAVRLDVPESVNWALVAYRSIKMQDQSKLDAVTGLVASALKAKDFSLVRANAWIESQNTGEPGVTFTEEELGLPAVLSDLSPVTALFDTPARLSTAKTHYRTAKSSEQVDKAIYEVANVLRVYDLNLARANAWIESQKDGTEFDLILEQPTE